MILDPVDIDPVDIMMEVMPLLLFFWAEYWLLTILELAVIIIGIILFWRYKIGKNDGDIRVHRL